MDYPETGFAKIKESERLKIQKHIEAFILNGGKIDRIESSVYSSKSISLHDEVSMLPVHSDNDFVA